MAEEGVVGDSEQSECDKQVQEYEGAAVKWWGLFDADGLGLIGGM